MLASRARPKGLKALRRTTYPLWQANSP